MMVVAEYCERVLGGIYTEKSFSKILISLLEGNIYI